MLFHGFRSQFLITDFPLLPFPFLTLLLLLLLSTSLLFKLNSVLFNNSFLLLLLLTSQTFIFFSFPGTQRTWKNQILTLCVVQTKYWWLKYFSERMLIASRSKSSILAHTCITYNHKNNSKRIFPCRRFPSLSLIASLSGEHDFPPEFLAIWQRIVDGGESTYTPSEISQQGHDTLNKRHLF